MLPLAALVQLGPFCIMIKSILTFKKTEGYSVGGRKLEKALITMPAVYALNTMKAVINNPE